MTDKSTIRTAAPVSPLTRMIAQLHEATPARRMAADPAKLAAHYKLPLPWVVFYLGEARRCPDVWPMK